MKKMLSMMLALIIVSTVFLSVPLPVSADSLYIRKIVSVVYDDSGSMVSSNKYAFANYAMQSFCGMLNSEDQLFVTYMNRSANSNQYVSEQIDLSAGGIQNSVDSIRSVASNGGTPFEAVRHAFTQLKSVNDSNPNTQYWLVVITDGEFSYSPDVPRDAKDYLNSTFAKYTNEVMPNGTKPQVTFLGIGNGVTTPDQDAKKGIYTYTASDAKGIIGAMSNLADKVSGRTRLQKSDLKQIDDKTIQISSSIPLLNIAVFTQGSKAKVSSASNSDGTPITISRKVSLNYPNFSELVGGAYLLGDSQNVIGAGTYQITFNEKVDLDDIIVLYEPALEMRMKISLNGKEITDVKELDQAMESDKITVSCKVYEMGTDKEVDPSLLPAGTKYEISISEDGNVAKSVTDKNMTISDFKLKNIATQIKATITISGFNPINNTVEFTPTKYVPRVVYTMSADYGSDERSVKLDEIAGNKDMTICFTVFADGVAMTDPEAVKALGPVISVSPSGNSGDLSYSNDGKIVFTPNAASVPTTNDGYFEVEVTCTLADGVTAKNKYTVLVAKYEVIPTNATQSVKKTKLFDNQVSVSFYITKDGEKLDKAAVEQHIAVLLNEEHSSLKTNVSVAGDGTITITPYSEKEYTLTFWSWWINWARYFGLSGDDIVVTMSHSFGTAKASIDVIEEDMPYIILNVIAPLALEIAILLFIAWWIYAICAKPRFLPGAVLYIANLSHGGSEGNRYHEIGKITEVHLKQYNALKYQLSPTLTPKKHYVGKNLTISPGDGGSIICYNELWYKGHITPIDVEQDLSHPQKVMAHIRKHSSLKIEQISLYDAKGVHAESATLDNPRNKTYYVHTKRSKVAVIDGIETITGGTIFAYAIQLK